MPRHRLKNITNDVFYYFPDNNMMRSSALITCSTSIER